jgi:hypothetical protein
VTDVLSGLIANVPLLDRHGQAYRIADIAAAGFAFTSVFAA